MDKILVSACLAGQPVRWDGAAKTLSHCLMTRWQGQGRLVALCPELAGGLAVPRRPAEIAPGATGEQVLDGAARILDDRGDDLTAAFRAGAEAAVALARAEGCRFALLIDGSPSCGSREVHDGRFAGRRVAGEGVMAAALRRAGVQVFTPADMARLAAALSG
ncbi:DUF523 domain-containing protein [Sinisalibacter aestuarii]|uniref:DUF523 domain-containing protein n=1 Tax=Sinisalibacter aestuarii TaxID=2949426 RepID=A0ABQ5LTT3_9RHOB|nr:2-thiouracil desulfurase family protein [Sinisalibacter aestuarii]GKY88394.1 hypothetical protein STA1M1_22630 [Sinisalibacter aestuarii]